ncbi:MAG: hypothetical protein DRQ55_07750 [Planctomycetota bacterium]|nr:MAG: hypothetical protein DRQ55_07750 [Planctomycetota bacterium]
MTAPDWHQLGFLTPDAPDCQREVWALAALMRSRLGDSLQSLAQLTAEPSWQSTLELQAQAAAALSEQLFEEAGEGARLSVQDDAMIRELDGALCEVIGSGHVPSLLVCGYAVLGELALVPLRLLDEVAGHYARATGSSLLDADHHRILGRLAGIAIDTKSHSAGLRRMLRHLNAQLADVHLSWRQTFHVLGVDGEQLTSASRDTTQTALRHLGLSVTRTDLAMFRDS